MKKLKKNKNFSKKSYSKFKKKKKKKEVVEKYYRTIYIMEKLYTKWVQCGCTICKNMIYITSKIKPSIKYSK